MILSDRAIRERMGEDLVIEPVGSMEEQLQPASFDCRLSPVFKKCREPYIIDVREGVDEYETIEISDDEAYILEPGEFVLGSTVERFEIPDDLVGHMEGRSSNGRLGIQVHATAGVCDPGFEGQITLELANVSENPVVLYPDMRISQMVFTQMERSAERPYGRERGSKYQDQEGPTGSRVEEDF